MRLGVDIGGTFTDIVVLGPDGTVHARKVLSTPDDYSRAIEDGVTRLLADAGDRARREFRSSPTARRSRPMR